jgi:hypothetical protein
MIEMNSKKFRKNTLIPNPCKDYRGYLNYEKYHFYFMDRVRNSVRDNVWKSLRNSIYNKLKSHLKLE